MATQRENDWDSGWLSGIVAGVMGVAVVREAFRPIYQEKENIALPLLVGCLMLEAVARMTRSSRPTNKDKSV